jgi:uncharacterized protein (DUF58 family)
MSSTAFSTKLAFPDRVASALRQRLDRWARRRGPAHPPLTLESKQIYILPTGAGFMLGLMLTAMLLGSLNFNNNLGLLTTFLVAGIGVLSMHAAHRNLHGLRIIDCSAVPVFAGQTLDVRVTLLDTRGRRRPGLATECSGGEPGMRATVETHGRAEASIEMPTEHRGWIEAPRIRLRTRFPIGWFEAWSWFWPEQRFLVWPAPAANAPPLPIAGRSQRSDRPGDESDEFHGLRRWREGDPLHRIAWKASQRHQTLLARQFTRPERHRIELRLADAPGRDFEERISVLARWVIEADRAEMEYGLDLGAARIQAAAGESHRVRCLNALAELE